MSLIREARDSHSNEKVNIVELRATSSTELRKYMEEIDMQRTLQSHYMCRLIAVDLGREVSGKWVVMEVREHCCSNLGAEIKKRKNERRPWTETQLVEIVRNIGELLAELQRKGVYLSKITLKSLLVRKNGEVILGSFRWKKNVSSSALIHSSVEKVAVILAEMMTLTHNDVEPDSAEQLLHTVDWTAYPSLRSLVITMRTPGCDFEMLLRAVTTCRSSPIEAPRTPLPPLQCLACNQPFTRVSFDPVSLRSSYSHYTQYLDKVCSIVCLDTYIKFTKTTRSPEESCMMCERKFHLEEDSWRSLESSEFRYWVCSKDCLNRALALPYAGAS